MFKNLMFPGQLLRCDLFNSIEPTVPSVECNGTNSKRADILLLEDMRGKIKVLRPHLVYDTVFKKFKICTLDLRIGR